MAELGMDTVVPTEHYNYIRRFESMVTTNEGYMP